MKKTAQQQNEQPAAPRLTAESMAGAASFELEVSTIEIEDVKAWLQRFGEIHRSCELLKERIDLAEAAAYSPRSAAPDGMPHSGGDPVDSLGRTVSRLESLRAKLAAAEAEENSVYSEIDGAIEQIKGKKSAERKMVLQLRYLDLAPWNSVNYAVFGGKTDFIDREESYMRRITYLHSDALKDLSAILDAQRAAETATQADEKI